MLVRLFVLAAGCLLMSSAFGWDSQRAAVPLVVDGRIVPYRIFAIYLMPGQVFEVGYENDALRGDYVFAGQQGQLGSGELVAPTRPGLYPMKIQSDLGSDERQLNIFVMVPATEQSRDKRLNGYRIGAYPAKPYRGLDVYRAPQGFVEVTRDNLNTLVSPNFKIRQFLSKQDQGFPKYVVLKANLLLKLENILASLNNNVRPVEGLTIMSGYRTPWYNRAIGNVPNSRHVFGGAADVYIDDQPRDGQMDDMNGDGKIDKKDAQWLATYINRMSQRGEFGRRIGGIGVYGSNSAHGPFVHVDVRGSRARW
ncbi:MAG: D-Ala-D-Ala carboxypeptidase family metallohydrolase [bacterium]